MILPPLLLMLDLADLLALEAQLVFQARLVQPVQPALKVEMEFQENQVETVPMVLRVLAYQVLQVIQDTKAPMVSQALPVLQAQKVSAVPKVPKE